MNGEGSSPAQVIIVNRREKMARWRLTAPHYLKVSGTTWEYKEIDRTTGRQVRKSFEVPLHLDPDQPADCNYTNNGMGEIIVCYEGKGEPRDIVFEGEPTPDMVPLDDEAKTISASFASKWKHPIESLSGSYADHLLEMLQKEVADARTKSGAAPTEGMTELLTAMTQMMKQNQEILDALLASKAIPQATARRA